MKSFYRIPESIENDIKTYKQGVEGFINGDFHATQFRAQRVPMGVYEQRVNNTYMMRIRIPAGGITPDQIECIAALGKQYGNGILHVTTRQDIQIHRVRLEDTPAIMDKLKEVGLITKGGGGNTVRNITACCDSGVCEKEVFDVSPYAIALTEHMIKDPRSYTLPRKFKVAFSGCGLDCSFATVNDVGFIAAEKERDGKKVSGFRVYVAGGMGGGSKIGVKLEEFISAEETADVCDAVKRVFDKKGNRKNKHRARLRFLMEKLGKDEFIRLYRQELDEIKKNGGTRLEIREIPEKHRMTPGAQKSEDNGVDGDEDYKSWLNHNVVPQRQNGYYCVVIRLALGDLPADRLTGLARLTREYGAGALRSAHDQNLLFRWVHGTELKSLFNALKSIGVEEGSMSACGDIVCCAGASTCRLGICLSRGLTGAISNELKEKDAPGDLLKDITIRISGCPNACGQHLIGKIGLFGAARRVGERLVPYYSVMLGGRAEECKTAFGEDMGLAPARDIPAIIGAFLDDYAKNLNEARDFYDYLDKSGKKVMKSLLREYSPVPSYDNNKQYYIDWGAEEEFSLAGRGAGECGAGVFDMIEVDLADAADAVEKAFKAEGDAGRSAPYLYEAVNRASRALLVTKGLEAKNDLEAFEHFEKEFINSGLVDTAFMKLTAMVSEYKKGTLQDQALEERREQVKAFAAAVKKLYDSMDDSLQFTRYTEADLSQGHSEKKGAQEKVRELMDLRGVKCPFNYVKAKLKLEMMEVGEELELYLDDGEPIRNVPNSLKNDDQEILKMEKKEDDFYRLIVKKKV